MPNQSSSYPARVWQHLRFATKYCRTTDYETHTRLHLSDSPQRPLCAVEFEPAASMSAPGKGAVEVRSMTHTRLSALPSSLLTFCSSCPPCVYTSSAAYYCPQNIASSCQLQLQPVHTAFACNWRSHPRIRHAFLALIVFLFLHPLIPFLPFGVGGQQAAHCNVHTTEHAGAHIQRDSSRKGGRDCAVVS